MTLASAVPWIGFAGAWLVFLGAVYQAVLELRGHALARERMESVRSSLQPPRASRWWWLIPPLKLMRDHSLVREHYLDKLYEALSPSELAQLMAFMNKAFGWSVVALGGLLLAINQTFYVVRDPMWFGITAAALPIACLVFARIALGRVERFFARRHAPADAPPLGAAQPPP